MIGYIDTSHNGSISFSIMSVLSLCLLLKVTFSTASPRLFNTAVRLKDSFECFTFFHYALSFIGGVLLGILPSCKAIVLLFLSTILYLYIELKPVISYDDLRIKFVKDIMGFLISLGALVSIAFLRF